MANEVIIAQGAQLTAQTNAEILIDAFLAEYDGKESSKKTYRRALRHYFGWIASTGRSIDTMTRADIITYRAALLEPHRDAKGEVVTFSHLTAAGYLNAVKAFYKWARDYGHYADIANIKQPKVEGNKFEKEPLTAKQMQRLMEAVIDSGNLRDIAIVSLLMNNGLRTIEVSNADIRDIYRKGDAHLLAIKGKGRDGKDRDALLSEFTYRAIMDYLDTRKGAQNTEPLFVSTSNHHSRIHNSEGKETGMTARLTTRTISGIAKKYLREIGICGTELESRKYTAHSLRHTFGTQLILNGVPETAVQKFMGHKSINTTNRYVYHADEEMMLQTRYSDIVSKIAERAIATA